MSVVSDRIFQQALTLPIAERAELLERLLATFQSPIDPKLDQLWINEAHDRLDAFDRGELEAVDIDEVDCFIKRDT